MSTNGYPLRADQAEAFLATGYWTGTGASSPTKIIGAGLTFTRTGVGLFTLSWSRVGARLAGLPVWTLAANTPANIAGFTMAFDYDSYSAANRTINCTLLAADNSTPAELAATMGLGINLPLTTTAVLG